MSYTGIFVLIFVFIVIHKVQSKCSSVECESDGSGDAVCSDWSMNGVGNELQQLFGWRNLPTPCSWDCFGSVVNPFANLRRNLFTQRIQIQKCSSVTTWFNGFNHILPAKAIILPSQIRFQKMSFPTLPQCCNHRYSRKIV